MRLTVAWLEAEESTVPFRSGDPAIMEETRIKYPQGCPTGWAVITGAGTLSAQYVIHAVGPIWNGGQGGETSGASGLFASQALSTGPH